MAETETQGNISLMNLSAQTGAQKTGEFFVDRALNAMVDGVKKGYAGAQVLLGTAFHRYLTNATQRYNQVRTLATGTTPRTIIGQDNVYVSIGVKYGKKRLNTNTVDAMLQISNNLLILGTGGIGKSMMMRYLFLNTANRGEYIPVLLELRKVSNQVSGQISILNLIYSCMNDFDVSLPKDQFEYSLRLGKYLFFMDGFDEVKENLAAETAAAIQSFCAKYPKNPCIITSRPRRDTSPLETFTIVESLPLTKGQAVSLASKIWKEDEKTKEFCRQLDENLYEQHRDFAENPLLLSMMFLTFMRNNSVPDHLADFYSKAYDALYSAHDSTDKGYYRREFHCDSLDESSFKRILCHFCFLSYFKEEYEFKRDELIKYLSISVKKQGYDNIKAADYLLDLQNVVCIIIEDGDIYRFSHRSFQAYFAACYTSEILGDEQQQKLFSTYLSGDEVFWDKEDYYELLSQMEPVRFLTNALEQPLRMIQEEVDSKSNPDVYFFRLQFYELSIREKHSKGSGIGFGVHMRNGSHLYYNTIAIFRRYVHFHYPDTTEMLGEVSKYMNKLLPEANEGVRRDLEFVVVDESNLLSLTEKQAFFSALCKLNHVEETRVAIRQWLTDLDKKREQLTTDDFLDTL